MDNLKDHIKVMKLVSLSDSPPKPPGLIKYEQKLAGKPQPEVKPPGGVPSPPIVLGALPAPAPKPAPVPTPVPTPAPAPPSLRTFGSSLL